MELFSILCGSLDGRRIWGRMDTCMCKAESLYCSPETIKTLLNGYTPIQMFLVLKKLKIKFKKRENSRSSFFLWYICVCMCMYIYICIMPFSPSSIDRHLVSKYWLFKIMLQ